MGLQANLTLKRFIQFSAGLQYQGKGSTYIENRMSPGITNGMPYLSKRIEEQEFKKICLPLAAGFTFRIWRLQPAFFAGIRPNFFFHGRYTSSFVYDATDPVEDYTSSSSFNPLEDRKMGMLRNQVFYGVSVLCFGRLKVSFTMTKKSELSYGISPVNCEGFSMNNNDYIFSLSWFCRKKIVCTGFRPCKSVRFI